MGEDKLYRLVSRDDATPAGADFSVIVPGDELEPYIPRGGRAYVSRRQMPENGQVGLFLVGDEMVLRQVCQDSFGGVYLFCPNRRRKDKDLRPGKEETLCCFGRVLLKQDPPLPSE